MRVSAVSYEGEARADGTAPVYLAVRHRGKRALLPLAPYGVPNVRPSQWNANRGEVRRGHDLADVVNGRVSEAA